MFGIVTLNGRDALRVNAGRNDAEIPEVPQQDAELLDRVVAIDVFRGIGSAIRTLRIGKSVREGDPVPAIRDRMSAGAVDDAAESGEIPGERPALEGPRKGTPASTLA